MTERGENIPFDLRALEVFLAVCDTGAMAAAARMLGLTQPAVSQTIAEIEARTGTVLFDRGVRPLGLTAAAGLLRQRASALLAEARQIAPLLRDVRAGKLPSIRVGLVDSLSRAMATELARQLAAMADQASILSGLTASHASALLTRQIDVVLGVDDLEDLDGIERWTLFEEPYVLLCPDGLPEARRIADLAGLLSASKPLVRYSARSKTGIEIDRHLRRLRLDIPRVQEFDTPFGVTSAVASGQGWAITTPLCIYEAGLPLAGLRCCPLPGPAFTRRLTLIAREKELGRIPRMIADAARAVLRSACVPAITQEIPWARDHISVGGGGQDGEADLPSAVQAS